MKPIHQLLQTKIGAQLVDSFMALRTLPCIGFRRYCPCCGWHLLMFTRGNMSYRPRQYGYCPRCNSKPRHRWLWLDMTKRTNILNAPLSVLHVSPSYSIARRLRRLPNIQYYSGDLSYRPFVQFKLDLTQAALSSNTFDAVICIHVLEHIEHDRPAIAELYRTLKPGGWAVIAVPVRMDEPTYEDPSIVAPQDRLREFGELDHFRYYGYDIVDRLADAGFSVETVYASTLDEKTIIHCDLRPEEVMFYCQKQ